MNEKKREAPPAWVASMHEFFNQNGYFRAEDVQKVLGDPRQCFQMRGTSDLSLLAKNITFDKG